MAYSMLLFMLKTGCLKKKGERGPVMAWRPKSGPPFRAPQEQWVTMEVVRNLELTTGPGPAMGASTSLEALAGLSAGKRDQGGRP